MKILIANERFIFRFGVDRALLLLGKYWSSWGHEVTFIGYRMDEELVSSLGARAYKIDSPNGEMNDHALEWLRKNWDTMYSSEPPDVIFFACWPFFKSVPFFKGTGASVVFFDCGAVPIKGQSEGVAANLRYLAQLRRRYLIKCDGIIAISDFIRSSQTIADSDGFPLCLTVRLGTDHLETPLWVVEGNDKRGGGELADRMSRRRNNENLRLIFALGRWEGGYKNSAEVLKFVLLLKRIHSDFLVLCLGDKPDLEIDESIAEHLEFVGFPDDVTMSQMMSRSEMGVCFSLWEGFNLPLAEMQMLGKPTLVYNLAAHPEVVAHPDALCSDLTDMVRKASAILSGKWLGKEIWANACEEFRKNFRWSNVAQSYLNALQDIAGARVASNVDMIQWQDRVVLVDVTNAVKDPANSGVMRVTRRFCRTLQSFCDPVFVVWSPEIENYVYPNTAELAVLGAYGGPSLPSSDNVSDSLHKKLLDWTTLTSKATPCWLIFTETVSESHAVKIRKKARSHGVLIAAVFHDAIPIKYPQYCSEHVVANHGEYVVGLNNVDVCLPNSQYSADCLRECWDRRDLISGRIVANLLPGEFGGCVRVDKPLEPPTELTILCVSTLEPRKNHKNFIAACLRIEELAPDLKWRVIMVGNRYSGKLQIADDIRALCERDARFQWLEVVNDEKLRSLYETCSFTVYPSLVEGFGMPIMESLWFGKPCICHREGVMEELARGGGCLVADVTDVESLRDAIVKLSMDPARWRTLSGNAQGRHIKSWRDYGSDFLRVLSEVESASTSELFHHVLYDDCFTSGWQMNESERTAFTALLYRLKPECAIEIGTYKGGSLSLLSSFCDMVFSIDIDADIPKKFSCFKNVSFLTGGSSEIIPVLLEELDSQGIDVGLILVDGDHSEEGVREDMNLILNHVPRSPLVIIMHDSWNPVCRRGLITANWSACPHVHYVDLDWVPGRLIENGSSSKGEVWGGLALAYLHPSRRKREIALGQTAQRMQQLVAEDAYNKVPGPH